MWPGHAVFVSTGAGVRQGRGHWFPPHVPCPGQSHRVFDTCAVWLAILQISAVFVDTYLNYLLDI